MPSSSAVEQLTVNQLVVGSIPTWAAIFRSRFGKRLLCSPSADIKTPPGTSPMVPCLCRRMKTSTQLSRRHFLKRAGLASSLLILPAGFLRGANAPSNRVNVACVGVGGMGGSDLNNLRRQPGVTIVGICDVHSGNLAGAKRSCPHAQTFDDYRRMLDRLDRDIDAVSVGTPDHTHFTISLDAVQRGKHIHVQKPMCRTVDQVRRLMAAAAEHKVVSQMGNQGHSSQHIRLVKEWYEAGLFGEVDTVEAWTTQRLVDTVQPQPVPEGYHPAQPPPKQINWDLWLGPTSARPYCKGLAPQAWRAYCEFGCGSLGDMAAHVIDPAYYILDLGAPVKIEVLEVADRVSKVVFPNHCKLVYHFPANTRRGPVKLVWRQGNTKPPTPEGLRLPDGHGLASRQNDGLTKSGSLFYGKKCTFNMGQYGDFFYTAPVTHIEELKKDAPAQKYPRPKGGHFRDWLDAIRIGGKAVSDFSYAGPLTEVIQLGVIAQNLGRTLEWDAKSGHFINDTEANALLKAPEPRTGFHA